VDTLTDYRTVVKQALTEWVEYIRRANTPGIETEAVFDDERGQYLIVETGWHNRQRVRNEYIHVRIRNGKIWIEEDGTEEGVANDLVKAGVPKEDIVLAFQPPELRHLTEFAVA
jgi:hypothetical protein